jgi:hypothetical protein
VLQAGVEEFVLREYAAGRSLRELAELTDRSFSAVRNILYRRGVGRRPRGARRPAEPPADAIGPAALASTDRLSAGTVSHPTVGRLVRSVLGVGH